MSLQQNINKMQSKSSKGDIIQTDAIHHYATDNSAKECKGNLEVIKEAFVKGVDTVREMIHEATAPSTEK